MKTPVLIVVIASLVVLCTLPAIYIFLAYHTHKERQRWKVDYDKAVKRIEVEAQNSPRPASAATHSSIYSSAAPGRASSARQSYYHGQQQPQAPARPAPVHNPRAAPPRPSREQNVSRSSRNYLPQADAAPRAAPEGVGRSVAGPVPGSRTTTRSGGTAWTSSSGSEKRKQEQVSQQIALQLLLDPSQFQSHH